MFESGAQVKTTTQSGTFNFGGNVGQTKWQVVEEVDGRVTPVLEIEASVFSSKLGFLTERAAMLRELSRIHHALIFRLLRPTRSEGGTSTEKSTGVEWLSTFAELATEILTTANRIERQAHNRITSRDEVTSTHKIRRPNAKLYRQMARNGVEETLARRSLIVERRRVQVDTPENRYLKFLLKRLSTQGRHWVQVAHSQLQRYAFIEAEEGNKSAVQAHLNSIEADLKGIERALKRPFWEEVGAELSQLQNKTSFLFRPLFVRFEKLSKTVQRAMKVHESGARWMGTLSMQALYETWSYLKLVEIADALAHDKEVGEATPKLARQSRGVVAFQVLLATGRESRIALGDGVFISAQRLFRPYKPTDDEKTGTAYYTPLVSQKPDLVFEVEHAGVLHLLDAKYRIDASVEAKGKKLFLNSAGFVAHSLESAKVHAAPKDEDINVMHRYRDAILRRDAQESEGENDSEGELKPEKKTTRYALILYPHKPTAEDLEVLNKHLSRINRFEIGAIPLCPGEQDELWRKGIEEQDWVPSSKDVEQVRVLAAVVSKFLQ